MVLIDDYDENKASWWDGETLGVILDWVFGYLKRWHLQRAKWQKEVHCGWESRKMSFPERRKRVERKVEEK